MFRNKCIPNWSTPFHYQFLRMYCDMKHANLNKIFQPCLSIGSDACGTKYCPLSERHEAIYKPSNKHAQTFKHTHTHTYGALISLSILPQEKAGRLRKGNRLKE